jgi:hypothetical protein
MFWIIMRLIWIRSLRKRQRELVEIITLTGMEIDTRRVFDAAIKEWEINDLLLKVIKKKKDFFASRNSLKRQLIARKPELHGMLSVLGSFCLPQGEALKIIEKEKWITQEIVVLERRLHSPKSNEIGEDMKKGIKIFWFAVVSCVLITMIFLILGWGMGGWKNHTTKEIILFSGMGLAIYAFFMPIFVWPLFKILASDFLANRKARRDRRIARKTFDVNHSRCLKD